LLLLFFATETHSPTCVHPRLYSRVIAVALPRWQNNDATGPSFCRARAFLEVTPRLADHLEEKELAEVSSRMLSSGSASTTAASPAVISESEVKAGLVDSCRDESPELIASPQAAKSAGNAPHTKQRKSGAGSHAGVKASDPKAQRLHVRVGARVTGLTDPRRVAKAFKKVVSLCNF
jgi:hypothetical protein